MSAVRPNVPIASPMYIAGDGKSTDGGALSLPWANFLQSLADGSILTLPLVIETPTGTMNGSNTAFSLAFVVSGAWLLLLLNGVYQEPGVDYTLTGASITFAVPPKASDVPLMAFYLKGGG